MKRLVSFSVLLALTLALANTSFGQVLDGAFARETTVKRNVVPLPYIREADAMYSKKILRILELKEKQNLPLYYPQTRMTYPGELQPQRSRVNLLYLVYDIGIKGKTFYKATGKEIEDNESTDNRYPVFKLDAGDITNWWREPIEKDDPSRDSLLSYEGTIKIADPYSDDPDNPDYIEVAQKMELEESDRGVMEELWVWEEWFFDKQRSVMDVKIMAMSFDGYTSEGRVWPFWIAYNDYRPLFTTYETFNSHNEAEHRTFDDIFLQRRFSSFIVAETNNYDNRLISDYLIGIEAIREGERIQDEMFKIEHDMWEF
ncbi:MAG: gliding motility protein GldN [Bacteroidales bacterium]|nr:gliding motility protein GldN [Bacteroidales bacterium]